MSIIYNSNIPTYLNILNNLNIHDTIEINIPKPEYKLEHDTDIIILDTDTEMTTKEELQKPFKQRDICELDNKSILLKYNTKNLLKLIYNIQIHLQPSNYIIMSTRILDGFISMIKMAYYNTIKTKEEIYIVCPTYSYSETNKTIDSQIVITGSVNDNETPLNCAFREIREEIGFKISYLDLYSNNYGTIYNNNHCVDNYMINLSTINEKNNEQPKFKNYNVYYRSKKQFVQILLYGTLNDIMFKFKNLHSRRYSNDILKSNKYIIDKVRLVNIKDIIKYYKVKI